MPHMSAVRRITVLSFLILGAPVGAPAQQAAPSPGLVPLRVVEPAFIYTAARACTDFFQYANGAWLAHDTIPAAYASSGVYRDMGDRNELMVRSVLDDAALHRGSAAPGSTPQKLGTFYATCMDSTASEAAGFEPIRPWLAEIDSMHSREGIIAEMVALRRRGVTAGFPYNPDPDPHEAGRYLAWLYQGGLGLPDRDYYTKPGAAADSTRDAYVAHVAKLFRLTGADSARAARDARLVMQLETSLAQASLTRVALREPAATDHPMSVDQLSRLAPAVDWPAYFRAVGVTHPVSRVNVAQPDFLRRFDSLLTTAPITTWQAYFRYHAIHTASPWLSRPFVDENFVFRSRFSGAKTLLPRWKRCLQETDGEIGEALGQAYVAKTFPPEAKARAKAVIDDIRAAFRERLLHLSWMSDSTRTQALDKLSKMGEKVGYPDHWRDYARLVVADGPFVLNVARAESFEWQRVADRPGSPVDTTEWGITVPTVDAYYDPTKNEMVFPAGALVPQTFDPKADDGANYGALGGSWAGHELTHGFDDEGRHYDAAGNLRDWWTSNDSAHFTAQADLVAKQFDGYIQVDTIHVNGRLTLGENIADYGGVLVGYDALQRALARNGRPGLIDGYTPEQRFFLGYAQTWRVHTRDASLRTRATTDEHAPERWRTNGPISNSAEFARAFGCKAGDAMVRPPALVPQIW